MLFCKYGFFVSTFQADGETDEVYAQMVLQPLTQVTLLVLVFVTRIYLAIALLFELSLIV